MRFGIETAGLGKRFRTSPDRREASWLGFLGRRRKDLWAVDDVNVRLEKGTIACLVGPNGAGKTTLLKILSSVLFPTRGTALIEGYNIRKEGREVSRRVGFLTGAERSLYWRLSGYENLLFFASLYDITGKEARKRIEELSHILQLREFLSRPVGECTSGIKQRFSIARTLIHDPDVLLLDEPTQWLDAVTARNVRLFIKERLVRRKGKTVLYTTQHLKEVDEFSGWIGIMVNGKIMASGTMEDLRSSTRSLVKDIEEMITYWVKVNEETSGNRENRELEN